jgi:aerobic-type carbon monoxide dehydrogenase small subunit (CoxS/CutS family)
MREADAPGKKERHLAPFDSTPQKTSRDDPYESQTSLCVTVNGKQLQTLVADRLLLSDFLREDLGLTALKVACGEGACGACTIMIDGEPARSCTLLAVQTEGAEILTLEGLNAPEGLDHVQQLFQQHHALQCGYCTPGWLMTVYSMIKRSIHPDSPEVSQYLSGHICRCTGYRNIWTAVRRALGAENEEPVSERE